MRRMRKIVMIELVTGETNRDLADIYREVLVSEDTDVIQVQVNAVSGRRARSRRKRA